MTREEAIKNIKKVLPMSKTLEDAFYTLHPELRNCEDERIRKELVEKISNLACGCFISQEQKQKFLAYLEKQKEQKPAEWSDDKFLKDIGKDATQFCFDKGFNITPHQAKEIATHYLMIGHNEGYLEGRKNAHIPARELGLPSSMDFKQEWSEEDESFLDSIEDAISSYYDLNHAPQYHYWLEEKLKSLRPQPKQEWSEEDEEMLNTIIADVRRTSRSCGVGTDEYNIRFKAIDFLESLRSQPHWKPSEEQITALARATNRCVGVDDAKILIKLLEQLEKLYSL